VPSGRIVGQFLADVVGVGYYIVALNNIFPSGQMPTGDECSRWRLRAEFNSFQTRKA